MSVSTLPYLSGCNLSVRNLSVKGWGAQLLNGVCFDVKAGEIAAIIGPNGAGKTTLMNTMLGDHKHHVTGDIVACGYNITSNEQQPVAVSAEKIDRESSKSQSKEQLKNLPKDQARGIKGQRARHIAVLPQFSRLAFPFTVEEVVSLSRIPHSTGVTIDNAVVNDALKQLDVLHLKNRLYTQLSGGEKQRVQLARVMAQIWRSEDAEQRLLLLDEPTSSLDLGHQQQLMQAVRDFADQGVAVVMVVHDINIALRHGDQVLALLCGKVIAQGEPENVVTSELINKLYNLNMSIVRHPTTGKLTVV